jgi:hypothetical protein
MASEMKHSPSEAMNLEETSRKLASGLGRDVRYGNA